MNSTTITIPTTNPTTDNSNPTTSPTSDSNPTTIPTSDSNPTDSTGGYRKLHGSLLQAALITALVLVLK